MRMKSWWHEGFLAEALQDFELSRWRSCVDNSQLAVENSGKTIIACFRPVEKSHNPARQVDDLLEKDDAIESLDIAKKCVEIAKRVYMFYFG